MLQTASDSVGDNGSQPFNKGPYLKDGSPIIKVSLSITYYENTPHNRVHFTGHWWA